MTLPRLNAEARWVLRQMTQGATLKATSKEASRVLLVHADGKILRALRPRTVDVLLDRCLIRPTARSTYERWA